MALGEDERRAQSSGEWPGVSCTFLRGLVGGAEWVGGGARPPVGVLLLGFGVRFGSGRVREGGSMRPADREGEDGGGGVGRGFRRGGPGGMLDALWAEFMAGNEGGGMLS